MQAISGLGNFTVSIQLSHRGTMTMFQPPALYQPPAVVTHFMKRLTIILLSLFCFESCIENRIEDGWAKVRKSCSIEEYQEYLIENPNTIHLIEIVDSLKIFWEEKNNKIILEGGHTDCYGNCLTLKIMNENHIEFNNQSIKREELKETIKYSIINPEYLPNLPDKETLTIPSIGDVVKSKGVIDIISENSFEKETYSEIIEIVKRSFLEIRNDLSFAIFNKRLEILENKEKEIIEQIVPMNIRFERLNIKEFEEPLPPKFDN
jgi:hypothetical protein